MTLFIIDTLCFGCRFLLGWLRLGRVSAQLHIAMAKGALG